MPLTILPKARKAKTISVIEMWWRLSNVIFLTDRFGHQAGGATRKTRLFLGVILADRQHHAEIVILRAVRVRLAGPRDAEIKAAHIFAAHRDAQRSPGREAYAAAGFCQVVVEISP